ncbi:hypothetical protein JRQ81_011703 [Phrynocephalus forsythii]|uniref:Uncharacterized protein n=1 Tax=Phrynocephalus forsythii TaxID=171643 RepID=A0A9Q0X797_9SAUR|nr:hypothetical protein JRQ81_011703 [Phrynocephalus forsythii]
MAALLRNATPLPDCHEVSRKARETLRHLCPLLPSRKGDLIIEDLEEEEEEMEDDWTSILYNRDNIHEKASD